MASVSLRKQKADDIKFKEALGTSVLVSGKGPNGASVEATLLYYGTTAKSNGEKRCGVSYFQPGIGKHDGLVNGHRYFHCTAGTGALVDPDTVSFIPSSSLRKGVSSAIKAKAAPTEAAAALMAAKKAERRKRTQNHSSSIVDVKKAVQDSVTSSLDEEAVLEALLEEARADKLRAQQKVEARKKKAVEMEAAAAAEAERVKQKQEAEAAAAALALQLREKEEEMAKMRAQEEEKAAKHRAELQLAEEEKRAAVEALAAEAKRKEEAMEAQLKKALDMVAAAEQLAAQKVEDERRRASEKEAAVAAEAERVKREAEEEAEALAHKLKAKDEEMAKMKAVEEEKAAKLQVDLEREKEQKRLALEAQREAELEKQRQIKVAELKEQLRKAEQEKIELEIEAMALDGQGTLSNPSATTTKPALVTKSIASDDLVVSNPKHDSEDTFLSDLDVMLEKLLADEWEAWCDENPGAKQTDGTWKEERAAIIEDFEEAVRRPAIASRSAMKKSIPMSKSALVPGLSVDLHVPVEEKQEPSVSVDSRVSVKDEQEPSVSVDSRVSVQDEQEPNVSVDSRVSVKDEQEPNVSVDSHGPVEEDSSCISFKEKIRLAKEIEAGTHSSQKARIVSSSRKTFKWEVGGRVETTGEVVKSTTFEDSKSDVYDVSKGEGAEARAALKARLSGSNKSVIPSAKSSVSSPGASINQEPYQKGGFGSFSFDDDTYVSKVEEAKQAEAKRIEEVMRTTAERNAKVEAERMQAEREFQERENFVKKDEKPVKDNDVSSEEELRAEAARIERMMAQLGDDSESESEQTAGNNPFDDVATVNDTVSINPFDKTISDDASDANPFDAANPFEDSSAYNETENDNPFDTPCASGEGDDDLNPFA